MPRFLFSLCLTAGLAGSAAAFAQTTNTINTTAGSFAHAMFVDGHLARPNGNMSHPMTYASDVLRASNLASYPLSGAPSQEFRNSVGK
jgi:hypothetical protein